MSRAHVHINVVVSSSISRTDTIGYSTQCSVPDRAVICLCVISGSQLMQSTNIFVIFLIA